jgi:hypothetical protein
MTPTAIDSEAREAALRDRIQDVYTVFRGYPLAPYIEPDACFPGACDDRPLRADLLHRLPPAAFTRYQFKAITTWGRVEDFKHFLPRLLEIVATSEEPTDLAGVESVEPWLVFEKLRYGDWQHWKRREREAIDAYFDAFWAALRLRPIKPWESLLGWLNHFAKAHDDLSRFLSEWEAEAARPTNEGLIAAAQLANSIVDEGYDLLKKSSLNCDNLDTKENQVLCWLASDRISQLLESAFFRWSDSKYAPLLSEGHYWLGLWGQRRAVGG